MKQIKNMTIYKIDKIKNDIGNDKIQTGYMTNVTKKTKKHNGIQI